jgi:toxin ParE1/3/4
VAFCEVRYSPRAAADLASIYEYLNRHSASGALRVMAAIYAAVEFARRHPQAAERTPIPGVRVKLVQRYRFKVFYRFIEGDNLLEIVHVRHTSRRPCGSARC